MMSDGFRRMLEATVLTMAHGNSRSTSGLLIDVVGQLVDSRTRRFDCALAGQFLGYYQLHDEGGGCYTLCAYRPDGSQVGPTERLYCSADPSERIRHVT